MMTSSDFSQNHADFEIVISHTLVDETNRPIPHFTQNSILYKRVSQILILGHLREIPKFHRPRNFEKCVGWSDGVT